MKTQGEKLGKMLGKMIESTVKSELERMVLEGRRDRLQRLVNKVVRTEIERIAEEADLTEPEWLKTRIERMIQRSLLNVEDEITEVIKKKREEVEE